MKSPTIISEAGKPCLGQSVELLALAVLAPDKPCCAVLHQFTLLGTVGTALVRLALSRTDVLQELRQQVLNHVTLGCVKIYV